MASKTPLDMWEKNAMAVEVEVVRNIRVAQYPVPCAWCGKKWLVIIDKTTRQVSGRMLCSCGEFFRWVLHPPTGATQSFRARAKARQQPVH